MILAGLFIISACLFLGHLLAVLTGIPAPGPVLGMGLLLIVLLVWRPGPDSPVTRGADVLLAKMAIFFVPAGVGVIAHIAELQGAPVAVALGLVLPWVVALVVGAGTAAASFWVLRRIEQRSARRSAPGSTSPRGTADEAPAPTPSEPDRDEERLVGTPGAGPR